LKIIAVAFEIPEPEHWVHPRVATATEREIMLHEDIRAATTSEIREYRRRKTYDPIECELVYHPNLLGSSFHRVIHTCAIAQSILDGVSA
jgi:hypothetical protein